MSRSRCLPFFFTFYPNGLEDESKQVHIPINGSPIEIENKFFKGRIMFIHDTGNEPECTNPEEQSHRKGVSLLLQGKFLKSIPHPDLLKTGLWVGGKLAGPLELGWVMQKVVQLIAAYCKKKTEGRLHVDVARNSPPQAGFPITQLFTVLATPKGEEPPPMSHEFCQRKWQGASPFEIDTDSVFTLSYTTPYFDLCSWEVLKVPQVSPLPVESILGNIVSADITFYDLGAVNADQTRYRDGALLEFRFTRGSEGDTWQKHIKAQLSSQPGEQAAVDDDSDVDADSVLSGEGEEAVVLDADAEKAGEGESESSEDPEEVDEETLEEIQALQRAESQDLYQIDGWQPHQMGSADAAVAPIRVPYYIEAIDRRRRRKVVAWFVVAIPNGRGVWWHARAASELAAVCRPKRRLPMFRRGPGARRYTCYAVKTLEQFRQVLDRDLNEETRVRDVIVTAAKSGAATPLDPTSPIVQEPVPEMVVRSHSSPMMTPSQMVQKVHRKLIGSGVGPPPRFFDPGLNPICALAFAAAREGRANTVQEGVVGAIHFEGRVCEELLRLSEDGIIRCFTPYDCDQPRIKLDVGDVFEAEAVEGLFLGRFHLWRLETLLREFLFCAASAQDRDEWVNAIQNAMYVPAIAGGTTTPSAIPSDGGQTPAPSPSPTERSQFPVILPLPSVGNAAVAPSGPGASVSRVASKTMHTLLAAARLSSKPLTSSTAPLLMDNTRARRWQNPRRMVLNDRKALPTDIEAARSPPSSIAAQLLETVLSIGEEATTGELTSFFDATCALKAVRFQGWSDHELLAFWFNVYHCLLLHGLLLSGVPASAQEMERFRVRVSYLVGCRPISLREIERVMLRIPKPDPQAAQARALQARVRQMLSRCYFCRRRSQAVAHKPRNSHGSSSGEFGQGSHSHPYQESQEGGGFKRRCFPIVQLPVPPWVQTGTAACLYLGQAPENLALPPKDLRAVMCLNQGTTSSTPFIPVYHSECLDEEMNEMCRVFVQENVVVNDLGYIMVTLPLCLQAIKRELKDDTEELARFLWQFRDGSEKVPVKIRKMKFQKTPYLCRPRTELKKLVSAVEMVAREPEPSIQDTAALAIHL